MLWARFVLLGVLWSHCCSGVVQADLILYSFQGTITSILGPSDVYGINVGDSFSGVFQYDTATASPDGHSSPDMGSYGLSASPSNLMNVTIDGLQFTGGPSDVQVANDTPADDHLLIRQSMNAGLPSGWSATGATLNFAFVDSTKSVFSGDLLPFAFNPDDFDSATIGLRLTNIVTPGGSIGSALITGTIDLDAPVATPEPSSLLLFSLAGGLPIASKVRRRRRNSADDSVGPNRH
ncbi:hypothetical protein Pan44_08460 [Caulifigura coniformis]|uniref:PEP-CTERM protein-sorting domain-containing protein n=1 Tax=Caulifigura coniformis TaxID=2527983 RepID=A0A517S9N9_9PLAN|nr:PEP-CTERM sorting domain-containing protein [Caulifigura coniformis]QDT52833.1 hypothetical protein Pan44_08460 [Caulifigura coniformis]